MKKCPICAHGTGLVKTIISYSAIKEISKDRESKTSIIKLTDGGFYPLPQTINEKEPTKY